VRPSVVSTVPAPSSDGGRATPLDAEPCICGHTRADHPEKHTGKFASMMADGCCAECWKIAGGGCPVFTSLLHGQDATAPLSPVLPPLVPPPLRLQVDPRQPLYSVLVRGKGVEPQKEGTLGPSNARWGGPLCRSLEEAEGYAEQKRRGEIVDGTDTPSGTAHGKEYAVGVFDGWAVDTGEWPPAVWPVS
jgi:hypothetical protein